MQVDSTLSNQSKPGTTKKVGNPCLQVAFLAPSAWLQQPACIAHLTVPAAAEQSCTMQAWLQPAAQGLQRGKLCNIKQRSPSDVPMPTSGVLGFCSCQCSACSPCCYCWCWLCAQLRIQALFAVLYGVLRCVCVARNQWPLAVGPCRRRVLRSTQMRPVHIRPHFGCSKCNQSAAGRLIPSRSSLSR